MMFRDRMKSYGAYILMAAVALASGTISVSGQKKRQKPPPRYILPADSIIRLRTDGKLSSKDARVGDVFASTVVTPVYVRGVEVIPAGSTITGSITHVERASRKSQAGSLNVTFTLLKIPNGKQYAIDASLATSDSAHNEGQVSGKSSKKRNARFIGRGVVMGGIFNGAAGAATGGLIGAARGMIKKGEEAEIDPGTEFNIIINRSVPMYAFR